MEFKHWNIFVNYIFRLFVVILIFNMGSTGCYADDTNLIILLKNMYNYRSWAGQTVTNYDHIVTDWTPDWLAMGITNIDCVYTNEISEGM